jgi:hypothetical protein
VDNFLPCTELLPGLVVLCKTKGTESGRIQVAAGTMKAPLGRYERGAIIPLTDWRAPRPQERKVLMAYSPCHPYGASITVLKMPASALASFRTLRAATAYSGTLEDVMTEVSSRKCAHGLEAFRTFVRGQYQIRNSSGKSEEIAGGIRINPPGLMTTTENSPKGAFVGLHLDDWSGLPLDQRQQAPNRICVNLGSQDRYFLFLNLTIMQMQDVLSLLPSLPKNASGTAMARTFFRLFPHYPVLRIRLGPGDAYIAPTEHVVHDGSTLGMTTPDVTLSLRGRFAVR